MRFSPVIAALNQTAQTFAGVFVDNRHDLDRTSVVVTSNWKSTAQTRLGASAVTRCLPPSRCRGVCGAAAAEPAPSSRQSR